MRTAFEQSLLLKRCSNTSLFLFLLHPFSLHRFREAWSFASVIDSSEIWGDFAKAALHHVDIELGKIMWTQDECVSCNFIHFGLAIRVYRRIGDVGMVWSLQGIQVELAMVIGTIQLTLQSWQKNLMIGGGEC